MDLVITWSLVIHMPFYCCLGHASPGNIYEIIILWPQEKETGVTNSTLSFQTLDLDQDHYPQGEGLTRRGLLPDLEFLCSSLMVPRRISQDCIFELCDFMSHTKEPSKTTPEAHPPFKPAKTGQVFSSGIQLEAVAMGFFRCWLISSLARDTWICS